MRSSSSCPVGPARSIGCGPTECGPGQPKAGTVNVPVSRIGAGMDEMVAAMRACWGPDPVEYEGRFYRIAPRS